MLQIFIINDPHLICIQMKFLIPPLTKRQIAEKFKFLSIRLNPWNKILILSWRKKDEITKQNCWKLQIFGLFFWIVLQNGFFPEKKEKILWKKVFSLKCYNKPPNIRPNYKKCLMSDGIIQIVVVLMLEFFHFLYLTMYLIRYNSEIIPSKNLLWK